MFKCLKSFFPKKREESPIIYPFSFEAKLRVLTVKRQQLQNQIASWEEEEALFGGSSMWTASERQQKYNYHGEMLTSLDTIENNIKDVKQARSNTAFNAMQRLHQQTYQSLIENTPLNKDVVESIEKMIGSKPSLVL